MGESGKRVKKREKKALCWKRVNFDGENKLIIRSEVCLLPLLTFTIVHDSHGNP